MERTTKHVPKTAPTSSTTDDDDELNIDLELDEDEQGPSEPEFDLVKEEQWVRVNDKAPIWMRYVTLLLVWTSSLTIP